MTAQQTRKTTLRVDLNGTTKNPFERMGFTQNPIPQLGRYEYDRACLHLAKLGGPPVKNEQAIRDHLKGFSDEFVDLCCSQFKKGEYVTFYVEWDDFNGHDEQQPGARKMKRAPIRPFGLG